MRPVIVVFDQPIAQFLVEEMDIVIRIALADKFLLKRTVEPLTNSIIFWRLCSAPPVLQSELLCSSHKIQMKFATVVSLNVHHAAVHAPMKSPQKISRSCGAMRVI